MGKWILGGIALTVCSAVGVYFAACHAVDHPGSIVSCSSVASQIVQVVNPSSMVGAVVNAVANPVAFVASDLVAEAVEPIVIEGNDEESSCPLQSILHFLTAGTSEITAPEDITILGAKPMPESMPYADEDTSEDEAQTQDDCCADCWLKSFVTVVLGELAEVLSQGSPEVQVEEQGSDETQEDASSEESADPANLPRMQEDPYYHHHYPSCPYTGRCPYPGSYVPPVVRPVEPVTPPQPTTPQAPTPPKKKFSLFGASSRVAHPEVDTMECRPTDLPRPTLPRRPY
jgi:hypothetical protein